MRRVPLLDLHHGRPVRRRVRLLYPSSNCDANCGAHRHAEPRSDDIANHHAPDFRPDAHCASDSQPDTHAHRPTDNLCRPDNIARPDHFAKRSSGELPGRLWLVDM